MLLYPTHAQSDFVKAFQENDSLADHLSYIFPCPWDQDNEFQLQTVDCYMDTIAGGLIKVGKKMELCKILASGTVELKDGLCRVYVVPKVKATEWIAEVKRRKGK